MAKDKETKTVAQKISRPGALHQKLGVPQDKKIPVSKIKQAASSGSPLLKKEAQFALNIRKK